MSWNSVIGQAHVKDQLRSALAQGRLAQAYLFSGPGGVGKDACAIELAKTVNCERHASEACDECPQCVKFRTLQHPNVALIFPMPTGKNEQSHDGPTEKLPRDVIGLIQAQVRLKAENPYYTMLIPDAYVVKVNSVREIRRLASVTAFGGVGGKKVFIIMNAEKMNEESSNALLKTLEEPLADTILILVTGRPEKLLPTVISRCQEVRFGRLSEEEIAHALRERESLDDDRARLIGRLANGSFERALALMAAGTDRRRDEAVEFLRTALYRTRAELLRSIEEIASSSERPEIEEFLSLLMVWLRDAMLIGQMPEGVVNRDTTEILMKFSDAHPNVRYEEIFGAIEKAISLLNKNVYIPLLLQDLALGMRRIILQMKPLRPNGVKQPGDGNSRYM